MIGVFASQLAEETWDSINEEGEAQKAEISESEDEDDAEQHDAAERHDDVEQYDDAELDTVKPVADDAASKHKHAPWHTKGDKDNNTNVETGENVVESCGLFDTNT